eukprot:6138040-Amphidinium_carterae.8
MLKSKIQVIVFGWESFSAVVMLVVNATPTSCRLLFCFVGLWSHPASTAHLANLPILPKRLSVLQRQSYKEPRDTDNTLKGGACQVRCKLEASDPVDFRHTADPALSLLACRSLNAEVKEVPTGRKMTTWLSQCRRASMCTRFRSHFMLRFSKKVFKDS